MGLETGDYIDDLVSANPTSGDNPSAGDDHLRLIKKVLKQSFPSITGAVSATQDELNILDGVTSTTAELNILDGVTALAADLNILAGADAGGLTAAELLYVAGLTSDAQTQLDGKEATISTLAVAKGGSGAQNGGLEENAQTGTAYTLVLTDAGKMVSLTNAAAITLTVPPNSSVAFTVGTVITLRQGGAGQVTLTEGTGVTINNVDSHTKIKGQYGYVSLRKTGTDTWESFGATA